IEGPFFTNPEEFARLVYNDLWIEAWGPFQGHSFPKRIEDYARGIFNGIQRSFEAPPTAGTPDLTGDVPE
ncbi:MAG: hypothetical protein V1798_10320, partial [Pseudomonadota bacterium]